MLLELGAVLTHVEAPFEPESGAYSAQHAPGHGGGAGIATIHEFAAGAAPQGGGPNK